MQSQTRLLVSVLLLVTSAYAIAEELTLVTYYPSPRGVYNELRTMGTTLLAQQTGSVGIGTATPQAKLDVSEGIKVGYQTGCDADRAGTIRYNSKKLEVCDGSGWVQAGSPTTGGLYGYCTTDMGPPVVVSPAFLNGPIGCACPSGYSLVMTGCGAWVYEGGDFSTVSGPAGCSSPNHYSCLKN